MKLSKSDFVSRIETGDPTIFDPVTPQLSQADMKSLLAIQTAVRASEKLYTYLEVGSYLGGSLQPLLVDPLCEKIYSIDSRPIQQPSDERMSFTWKPVTTAAMLDKLRRKGYGDYLAKLECIDGDTRTIEPKLITSAPSLLFIDGEHTDAAAYDDFVFCSSAAAADAVFVFHDMQIVYKGIERCLTLLQEKGTPFRSYLLPGKICVIETGSMQLAHHEAVFARLTGSGAEMVEAFIRLGTYRDLHTNRLSTKLSLRANNAYMSAIGFARKLYRGLRKRAKR